MKPSIVGGALRSTPSQLTKVRTLESVLQQGAVNDLESFRLGSPKGERMRSSGGQSLSYSDLAAEIDEGVPASRR